MDLDRITEKIFRNVFKKFHTKAWVYLQASKSKNENYDPFRDTGYEITSQNPLPVKVLTKTISPSSLIFRELGLTKSGSLQIILHNRDVDLIKNSIKITIDGTEYYVYDDAVGSKFQIFPTSFTKFSKIILFRKNK